MNKFLIITVGCFSMLTFGQESLDKYYFNGHWITNETIFELVILYNEADGFQFLNFNIEHGETLEEQVVKCENDIVETILVNPRNGWTIQSRYKMISIDEIEAEISGDYNGIILFTRRNCLN